MGKSKSTTKQSSTSNTNQTQTNSPFAPAMPGLTQLAGQIQNATNAVQGMPGYTGDFIATGGQLQQDAVSAYQQAAAQAQQLVNPALQAANVTNWKMPTFYGPGTEAGTHSFGDGSYDPSGVDSVVQAAIQPYMRQLMEQVLPSIQSAGIESGAYSNDRAMAIMPGQAVRDTGRMASEVAAQVAFQDFQAQQARQLEAFGLNTNRALGEADVLTARLGLYPELLNNVMNMSSGSADLTMQAANYDTAMRQAELNNALARDQYNANLPFRGLDQAASLYGTFAPYGTQTMNGTTSSQSKSTQTQQQPIAGQILQGALGVGSMIAGFPGASAALGLGGQAMTAANPLLMGTAGYQNPFMQPLSSYGYQPSSMFGG
jgi:hypothetical protein